MRFSELLKNKSQTEAAPPPSPPQPVKPTPPPVAKPEPPAEPPPTATPQQPPPPTPKVDLEAEKAKLENKLREEFEDKFQSRLEGMMDRLRQDMEEKVSHQEERFEKQQNTHDTEKKELLDQIEALKSKLESKPAEPPAEPAEKKDVEAELKKRVEEEREKIQKDVQEKLSKSHQSMVEQLQQKIKDQEKELAKKPEPPKAPESPKPAQPAKPAQPPKPPAVTPPAAKPAERMSIPKPASPAAGKPALISASDPDAEKAAKTIYNDMLRMGDQINHQVAQSGPIELDKLKVKCKELVEMISENDAPYVGLTLQAYPSENYFSNHSVNCAFLSIVLGLNFELSKEELMDLGLAGFLHDIGLVSVRENLDYPKQLPPDIKQDILNHPLRSRELLGNAVSEDVLRAIEQHHETCDGKGYPGGVRGEEIHHYAKIIQCVDAFEALIHERPYRKTPMPVNEAMKELIEKGRGTYDALVLKSLMGRIGLYPVMSMVELSNRQIGRVLRQNPKFPLSPVIRIEFDEEGNKYKNPPVMDLTENQMMHIVGPVSEVSSYAKRRLKNDKKQTKTKPLVTKVREVMPVVFIGIALILLFFIILKV